MNSKIYFSVILYKYLIRFSALLPSLEIDWWPPVNADSECRLTKNEIYISDDSLLMNKKAVQYLFVRHNIILWNSLCSLITKECMSGGFVSFVLFYKDYMAYLLVVYGQIGEKMVNKCCDEGLIKLNIWPNEYKLLVDLLLRISSGGENF